MFSLWKKGIFPAQIYLFRRTKLVCQPQSNFSKEKMVFQPNFFFGQQEAIFLESGRIVFQKMFFVPRKNCFFEKTLVFLPKTIFVLGNFGFCTENQPSLSYGKPRQHLFGVWPCSFSKDVFLAFWFSLQNILVFEKKSTMLQLSACSRRS